MVDGNSNGNGRWRRQQRWVTVTATAMELATAMETATAVSMATATARATMTEGELPLYAPAMCSAVAGATPCLHPHGHKGVCIHQHAIMGETLHRLLGPTPGGGGPDSSPWIVFLFFTSTVQFTEQPSVCPPHYSGAQEPCRPIDSLPPPLLFHIFAKVSLGGAWIVCLQHAALWHG
jgi:hypothetical protein